MNISTSINTAITAPRFPALAGAYGYSDSEAQITIPVGATYWNVTLQTQRYWNGSIWASGSLPAGVSCTGSGTSQVCTFSGTVAAGTRLLAPGGLLPSATSINVLCLGDSICGYGSPGNTGGTSYTALLEGLSVLSGRVASTTYCSYSGQTIAYVASQYAACAHPVSPAVTGVPGLLLIEGGTNDLQSGTTLATMESGMSGILSAAAADGWVIGVSNNYATAGITYRATDYLRREPFNSWLSTKYQAGAFKYYFDWDSLLRNPFDANVLDGGVHPANSSRNLIAIQMNNVLAGNGSAPTASSLPPTTLMNIPFWDITAESTAINDTGWTYLGEWSVGLATGNATRSLTLTLGGEGCSYDLGILYVSINSNSAQSPIVNGVQGAYYGLSNISCYSASDVTSIAIVEHPGTTEPGFDWDIYVQTVSMAYFREEATTSSLTMTWLPAMIGNATSPGPASSTVKYAELYNVLTSPGGQNIKNTGAGNGALQLNTSVFNTAFGYNALSGNLTSAYNTAVGANALSAVTSGYNNTAVGYNSGASASTVTDNTSVGATALALTTIAGSDTAVGSQAMAANTTGSGNTAVGAYALQQATNQNNSTAIGTYALKVTTGANSTAVGYSALSTQTTGIYNTAIGTNAGSNVTTGYELELVGYNVQPAAVGDTNEIVIGYAATGNGSNTATIGNAATTGIYMGTTKIPVETGTTPTVGAGVCWKTTTTLGTCTAGTWPSCTTCN